MSYGLSIWNERNHEVFNSSELPYRFTAIAEPFDEIIENPSTPQYKRYRKVVEGLFSDEVMISAEIPDGIGGRADLRQISGQWTMTMRFSQNPWHLPAPSSPPVFYMMDRVPPESGATGFGIEIYDENGQNVLNSSTPLVQVRDVVEVTTLSSVAGTMPDYVPVAPSDGSIMVVENMYPGRTLGSINYLGGSNAYFITGWFMDIKNDGGWFHVRVAEWLQEAGEGTEFYGYAMPLRCIIIEKPTRK